MITIKVSGDRGEGKTVTAMRIVQMLRGLGFPVKYKGYSSLSSRMINRELTEHPDRLVVGDDPREFLVLDDANMGIDFSDEAT